MIGGLGEWLNQQFAKLSLRNRRNGSNPLPSAILEDAVRWFLLLPGKQATGVNWSGFNSSFFRHASVV